VRTKPKLPSIAIAIPNPSALDLVSQAQAFLLHTAMGAKTPLAAFSRPICSEFILSDKG
jgi:hypothetical protein